MDKIEKYFLIRRLAKRYCGKSARRRTLSTLVFILGNCGAGITTAAATLLHDNLLLSHAEN
jgi:hypothetical protein